MKIAHFGTFDVLNYGDLLFPTIAQHFLADLATEWLWVSPKGGPAICPDAVDTISLAEAADPAVTFDLALIGGGNIITVQPTPLADYQDPSYLAAMAYPGLWIGACLKAARLGAAIAWNAPGGGRVTEPRHRGILQICASHSDYVAFREAEPVEWLRARLNSVAIVPDTAIAIANIWPKAATLDPVMPALCARHGIDREYFVFHIKQRNLRSPTDIDAALKVVDAIADATGALPILLPIGLCHEDDTALLGLSRRLRRDHRLIYGRQGLKAITALIANARCAFTSSLHCAIVATAYGVPAMLLANRPMPKYHGFFDPLGMAEVVSAVWPLTSMSWASTELALSRQSAVAEAVSKVEAHFAALSEAVRQPRDRQARGQDLTRAVHRNIQKNFPLSQYMPFAGLR